MFDLEEEWRKNPEAVVIVAIIVVAIVCGFLWAQKDTYDRELAKAKACHGYLLYRGKYSVPYAVCQEK
jgi:predicted negative regulator of RcsB-dependent stress response